MADSTKGNEEGSREQMEVRMHRLIVTIALLGAGGILATWEGPTLAAEAVTAPGVQLVGGYKYCDYNGCYYCQRRECDDYHYSYGHQYCKHYTYYDCSGYGGGGGGGGHGY
jgi:hypothetical protein